MDLFLGPVALAAGVAKGGCGAGDGGSGVEWLEGGKLVGEIVYEVAAGDGEGGTKALGRSSNSNSPDAGGLVAR